MKTQLELVFLDSAERQCTVRVDNPRTDVTEAEILAQMQAIVAADVFETAYGNVVGVVKANVVSTEVVTYNFA